MAGARVLFKSLTLVVIGVLFTLPFTLLKRNAVDAPALLQADGGMLSSVFEDPRIVKDWRATELEEYFPDKESSPSRPPLSDKINGGDVQYYEFGFKRLFARELAKDGDRRLYVEEYVMADPVAAFGIWSANRGPSDRTFTCVVPATGMDDRALLQNGNRFCTVTAENLDGTPELANFVETLGGVLREFDPSAVPHTFPFEGIPYIPGTERIVVGPIGAQSIPIPAEVLHLNREMPAWVFSVPCGESFVPAVSVAGSDERWRSLLAHFGRDASAEDSFVVGGEDDRTFVSRVDGQVVIGSMITSDAELASFRKALGR